MRSWWTRRIAGSCFWASTRAGPTAARTRSRTTTIVRASRHPTAWSSRRGRLPPRPTSSPQSGGTTAGSSSISTIN
ncbi:uncharacterized protein ACA1_277010 [Acanthamoeba castellanii str. Neff]|uniref:Secreted protein n=1 Tax=Acanthamoeba castellanii (strain ATCC 30010 / Neff) TaxID=1257118 RepID=L8GQL1_ACACF|nr:uncharacterized protein ACA1_277010 [Acanthamoeba castellanii str. Neff]ELR15454.1 hypothetical protein ACA1_277010 [Acanthamoeba castellanii str. Neff]